MNGNISVKIAAIILIVAAVSGASVVTSKILNARPISSQIKIARAYEGQLDPMWVNGDTLQFAYPEGITDRTTVIRIDLQTGQTEKYEHLTQGEYTDLQGPYSQNTHPQNSWITGAKTKTGIRSADGSATGSYSYLGRKVVVGKGSEIYLPSGRVIRSTIKEVIFSKDGRYALYPKSWKKEEAHLTDLETGKILWKAPRGANEFYWSPTNSSYLVYKYAGKIYFWQPGQPTPEKLETLLKSQE
jgi:hypothetical protein